MFETQGGHAESNPRPSEEGVGFYHVFRPLDRNVQMPGRCQSLGSIMIPTSTSDMPRLPVSGSLHWLGRSSHVQNAPLDGNHCFQIY